MSQTLLLIEDEKFQADILIGFLEKNDWKVQWAPSQKTALAMIEKEPFELIVSDYRLQDGSGEEVLEHLQTLQNAPPFILVTAFGNIELAVRMMQKGAYTFIEKPINLNNLLENIKRAGEKKRLQEENRILKADLKKMGSSPIIHQSRLMVDLLKLAGRAAETDATIIIYGESGTGKELLARYIHEQSKRNAKNMVNVNCAALSPTLLESELFGHVKGAFTGADTHRMGRFEQAHQGTLFLDEIGEISPEIQVKLLRVLQEKIIERVGSNQPVNVDIRLITATNRNLEEMIRQGAFRSDLFFRLNVFNIEIPPLRNHTDDIIPLTQHFIQRFARQYRRPLEGISDSALQKLMNYSFPGNIRELQNIIERSIITADGIQIKEDDILIKNARPVPADTTEGLMLEEKVAQLEKNEILLALRGHPGNQTRAANALGITERVLRYKLQKYHIDSARA